MTDPTAILEEAIARVRELCAAAHLAVTIPAADCANCDLAPCGCDGVYRAWTLDPADVLAALAPVFP